MRFRKSATGDSIAKLGVLEDRFVKENRDGSYFSFKRTTQLFCCP